MSSDLHDDAEHGKFQELCALASSGGLTPKELAELKIHLERCASCRETLSQYRALGTRGFSVLADSYVQTQGVESCSSSGLWKRLLARLRADQAHAEKAQKPGMPSWLRRIRAHLFGTSQSKKSSGHLK
jgi:anti-sigma factor RsiW